LTAIFFFLISNVFPYLTFIQADRTDNADFRSTN